MLRIFNANEYTTDRKQTYAKILDYDSLIKRLQLDKKLKVHQGCVNSIAWNTTGEYILSGSDDLKLVITNPFNGRVAARIPSGHRRNIFQAKFLPETGNRRIVSCAVDGSLAYTQLESPQLYGKCMFKCHRRTAYQVQTTPGEPHTFLSSSEDGTIRWFDVREQESCLEEDCRKNILVDCQSGVNSMDVDPVRCYYLAAGSNDSIIRIFDRRMMKDYDNDLEKTAVRQYRLPLNGSTNAGQKSHTTCLKYDRYGAKLLANTTPKDLLEIDCWTDEVVPLETPPPAAIGEEDDDSAPQSSEPRNMRVRLRGDWSDTGPSAVPENEPDNGRELSRSEQIFRDMSAALTNVLRSRREAVNEMQEEGDIVSDSDQSDEQEADPSKTDPASCPSMNAVQTFTGHRNQRTAIKQCTYWGEKLVVAGSDCGHIFLWRRESGELVNVVEGDKRVVNCVQPHQFYPILATSGIDYDIKLWTFTSPEPDSDAKASLISKVLERNRKMLEDSDEVVTLPARFILPLLALLGRHTEGDEREDE